MGQRSPLRAGIHAVQTTDGGDLVVTRRDTARDGRAAAMQRRRQLAKGKRALNAGRTPAGSVAGAPALTVYRGGAG